MQPVITRRQRINRKNAESAMALRLFLHGTKQEWDVLVLIATGEFTEPAHRPKVRHMSDGQILPTEEYKSRKIWNFFAARFDAASPDCLFDCAAAKRVLHMWSNLSNRCVRVDLDHLHSPTVGEWRKVAEQIRDKEAACES